MGEEMGNMRGGMGGMGGMPKGATFRMSSNMGDMNGANIDPNEIFKMFFGGMGGMGARMGGKKSGNTNKNQHFASDDDGFQNFGGF